MFKWFMLHLSGWQSQVLCAVIRKRKHELLIVYVVPITSKQLEVSSSAPDTELDYRKIKSHKELIDQERISKPRKVLGVLRNPVWVFVEVENFIFPQLHAEIGIVNIVLDKFYSFIDDQVEAITPEEATSRYSYVVGDVVLSLAIKRIMDWKEDSVPQLEFHRVNRIQCSRELWKKGLSQDEVTNLRGQKEELDHTISLLVWQRKNLEANLSEKRKNAAIAKSELKQVREKKLKVNMPVFTDIKNILVEFGITAAAYHGGKLNGVDCWELIKLAKPIFEQFQTMLLSVSHPGRCSNDTIVRVADKLLEDLHYFLMQAN
jgi:hypothetical protein